VFILPKLSEPTKNTRKEGGVEVAQVGKPAPLAAYKATQHPHLKPHKQMSNLAFMVTPNSPESESRVVETDRVSGPVGGSYEPVTTHTI
jgi:hypothetical protein